MENRLEKAKATRSATAEKVAAQVRTRPSTTPKGSSKLSRIGMNLPHDLIRDVERALFEHKERTGTKISASGFVEVALRELLARDDLGDVLTRYGARARRADLHG